MGCGIQHVNKINIQTEIFIPTKKSNDSIETKHSFNRLKLNKISKNNWLKIIDYLQYQELKEVAKTNRLLNYLSKDDKILIKFFKKKNDIIDFITPYNTNTSFNDNKYVQNIIDGVIN
jgi:RIO-like serine/threonine protein kinase